MYPVMTLCSRKRKYRHYNFGLCKNLTNSHQQSAFLPFIKPTKYYVMYNTLFSHRFDENYKKMKQILLSLAAMIVLATASKAQCNQTVQISSAKTNMLNASYQPQGSRDEKVVVDITPTTVTVTPNGNAADAMIGKIKEQQCDWKIPFKEGKTIIKTDLVDPSGDVKDATITIEGKDGKITLLAEAKEHPDQKLQLEVNKFEAKPEGKQ